MAGLTILAIGGVVAITVQLACLKGFSQALRHKKVSGAFVRVEKERRGAVRSPSRTLLSFSRRSQLDKDLGPRQVSGGTVAMMSLVIALGAHRLPGETHSPSSRGERAGAPGVQPPQSS